MIIIWGGLSNHNRKYIPVDVNVMNDLNAHNGDRSCSKGFVNVFSSSIEEPGALVCCNYDRETTFSNYSGTAADGICDSPPPIFFFTRRLARFPEAWLLPLFPLFLRLSVHFLLNGQSFVPNNSKAQHRLARRRFYLYIGLIQLRGWILYLLFDKLEEYFVASAGTNCWYENLLHRNYNSCQGQDSDFSDHIVLYFAQILPIPLMEALHSIAEPFWKNKNSSPNNNCSTTTSAASSSHSLSTPPNGNSGSPFRLTVVVPGILITGLLYLYIVTFMGAYKTAKYFHTFPEIANGYLISLVVQIPLFLMQCTTYLEQAREYFFGYAL
jgi:hypothetical protein